MKKKALGFVALATAFMATTAIADSGAIRSIDPCDQYGYPIAVDTTPKTAGQTAYFRIRLLNVNSLDSYNTKGGTRLYSPWIPDYNDLTLSDDAKIAMWASRPPKIGVYVSGQLRGATVAYPYAATDDTSLNGWEGWYTDLVCAYTVQPGDIALPMTLANSNGREVGSMPSPTYYFDTIPKSSVWRLIAYKHAGAADWGTIEATNVCVLAYGTSSTEEYGGTAVTRQDLESKGGWTTDYNLSGAGHYIQSVDFTQDEYDVPKGQKAQIQVDIIGGVNTNGNGTVYALTKDLDAVNIAEDDVETITISDGYEMDGTYQVCKVTIPTGVEATPYFRVYGVESNKSATVYLSATKKFVYGQSGDLVTNFVTAVVNCVEPPPPYITVTIDGASSKTVTADANYASSKAKLTVALSEAFTNEFTVNITPSMVSGSATAPLGKYVSLSAYSEDNYLSDTHTLTFPAGVTSKDLFIYVLGGDDDTAGAGKGIKFAAAAVEADAAAYFCNENVSATLSIRKSTPIIAFPTEDYAYTGLAGGVNTAFTVKIADDYADIQKPYTIEWYKTGSGSPLTIDNLTPNADGEVTFSVRYNYQENPYSTTFRAKNSNGVWSDYRRVSVQVNPAKQISAVIESPDDSGEYPEYDDGDVELSIRFKLTEGYDDSTLYAFLVPMDEASSNLVVCKAFTTGVAIKSGDTESTTTAKMQLLDGNDDSLPLSYSIVLRTAKTWNTGDTIGIYESKDLEIYVNNIAPKVAAVNMSGSAPLTVNGGTFQGKASVGLNKIFTLEAEDVEADLTNEVTAVWTFSDPNGYATTHTVTAPVEDIELTHVFEVAGTYTGTVKLHDKDMGNKKYGPEFTFKVEVLDKPSLMFDFPNSNTYDETEADRGTSMFYVKLSTPASRPIEVELECTRVGADGVLNLATNRVAFRAGQMQETVNIDELDGTTDALSFKGGFSVTARVITETVNEDGIPWKDVYLPATTKMYVRNEAPVIDLPIDYGITNQASINVEMPIKWQITDVSYDMTNNLTVTWDTSEGVHQEFTGEDVWRGVFTNVFKNGGAKVVTMTVTDKDNGTSTVTLYYRVAPSKTVNVYAQGPYQGGGISDVSKRYAEAAGIGAGRVWSDGGTRSIDDFVLKLTFGVNATTADIYAWGYKNGQVDDGTLVDSTGKPDRDIAIGPFGDSFRGAFTPEECYVYPSAYDSFFYAWVIDTKEEKAITYTGTALVSPVRGNTFVMYPMSLPTDKAGDDEHPYFEDRHIEAFFSRELYTADNMGDMNADGIPDRFATFAWSLDTGEAQPICQVMTGVAITSEGNEEGEGGGSTASDLTDVSAFNGDEDFLPNAWRLSANPLKPTTIDWGPGEPFKAIYEIRGMHEGLNEPGVSEYSLSEAEIFALFADYVEAANVLTGVYADDYAAATNWAKATGWTPEAISPETGLRLNPCRGDTDGDGFDDGWEYFFWYYAKIGFVDADGVWGRLEGRRYDIANPSAGTRITPAEIVAAFNPHVASVGGRDFDGDGLTDFEEYVLGTNPCDWDSDGDGLNDLWEVMNGIDPQNSFDAEGNPDCDFMARCDYAEDTFTVFKFADGSIFGLPSKTAPTFNVTPVTSVTNLYAFTALVDPVETVTPTDDPAEATGWEEVTADDGSVTTNYFVVTTNWTERVYYAAEPVTVDNNALTEDVPCYETVVVGDTTYLASFVPVTLPAGTGVVDGSVAAESEDVELVSAYYEVKIRVNGGKAESFWFAEKPELVKGFSDSRKRLVKEYSAFATYEYTSADGSSAKYLGEPRTFAAGTVVASVADAPTQMTPVCVEGYMGTSGGFSWINPETLEREATMLALPLFNYGGDGETYVPCALSVTNYMVAPVAPDLAEARSAGYQSVPIVKVENEKAVTLIHNQVFSQYGFDPRVAWNIDDYGFLDQRWRKEDSDTADGMGAAGMATNTVQYTTRDEYLVMHYRQQMRKISDDGKRSATVSLLHNGSIYLVGGSGSAAAAATVPYFSIATTCPNLPVSFVRQEYASRNEVSPFDNSTNRTIVAYWTDLEVEKDVHGADTDGDGVPDGWELYVDADPNNFDDGKLRIDWAKDGDDLNVLEEYAGVDSCNAYTNRFDLKGKMIYPEVETITKHHPGKDSGWWNKFFPTNPYSEDTDGDGVKDDFEGKGFKTDFYVGNTWYGTTSTTFIYGMDANSAKYAANGDSTCFRGGGLNPCTVDTDGDLIPDAWEFQFAGIVFTDGQPEKFDKLSTNDLKIVTMADGKQKAVSDSGSEIRGGMDGTWKGDACFDFDHDGLANYQEYLVQSLRHLRYDDNKTPLMGMDPGSGQFLKFIPFTAWDGEFFHKTCLENGFTGLGTWQFRDLGYFALPPHEWDMLAQNTKGIKNCAAYKDYEGPGYRVMLPPYAEIPTEDGPKLYSPYFNGGRRYVSTDPRRWDSDEDGMDDYYEIFHGLNPLLGSAAYPFNTDDYEWSNLRYDVIGSVYGIPNAWQNHWTGWPLLFPPVPDFDAIRYPWMIGTMECDADGDGLRNDEESIKVNLAAPNNTHTDPTPLWMTDSTSLDSASFTAQYYMFDPYGDADAMHFPWTDFSTALRAEGASAHGKGWMFPFEENEGYDTDHDFKVDATELTKGVEGTSSPRVFSDPDRRQALYFPGFESAAASRDGQFRRAVCTEPDLLKQFTVECWVRPDGGMPRNAVFVERICNYGASTLTYNTPVLRANFRVGADAEGRVYGEFEGSTANSGSVRATAPAPIDTNDWTHVAFTFDGNTARLYLNGGTMPVASVFGAGLIPGNGVSGIQQEYNTSVIPYGYVALPCATVLGAGAVGAAALDLSAYTSWDDFDFYFKGWIDEVRIWDGARSATELHDNYMKHFTMDDVKALRSNDAGTGVFDKWREGATRANGNLPAELVQHYSFTTLPGGVEPQNVMTEPPLFQANVFDNVRKPNGRPLDSSLQAGWWSETPVHSTVYWNYAVIPWIGNTVAHLPYLDGSSPDSQYWASTLAGVILPGTQGFDAYSYLNDANPYPYYMFNRERNNRLNLLRAVESGLSSNEMALVEGDLAIGGDSTTGGDLTMRWSFQLRSDFIGTSDLVPLGGAFAKRGTDFWDGQGAMDAWTETSADGGIADSDGNGIPDWAEALGYTTAEAYLRDLRKGLLPDGTFSDEFVDIADVNGDGVADWWERLYGIEKVNALEDTDYDGLSVVDEYQAWGEFGDEYALDPTQAMTDGYTLDYFRRTPDNRYYLGEVFTDHDFIEDWWEDGFDVDYINRHVYDAGKDGDGDGWSNWAERRARTDPSASEILSLVSSGTKDDQVVPGYPQPMVAMSLTYDSVESLTANLVVKAWKESSPDGRPDAVWKASASEGGTVEHKRFIGLNPGREITLNLGPGHVAQSSFHIQFLDPNGYGSSGQYTVDTARWVTPTYPSSYSDRPDDQDSPTGTLPDATGNYENSAGTINYRTGDVTIDFTKWQEESYLIAARTTYNLGKSYVQLVWKSRMVGTSLKRDIYFSTPDPDAESLGRLCEGKYRFVAFADMDGNGEWDEGEPFGMAKGVEVGWSRVTELRIGLTADSATKARMPMPVSGGKSMVSIIRNSINGANTGTRVVFKDNMDFAGRPYISEADVLKQGNFDLDWKTLVRDAEAAGIRADSINEVGYTVSMDVGGEIYDVNTFTKVFPGEREAPVPVRPSKLSWYRSLTIRPEFVWSGSGGQYTAFVLEIATNAAADAVVWSSGTNLLPYATEEGFTYKAPVFVGFDLEDNTTYYWRVAQLNAKWPNVESESAWSDWAEFVTAVDSSELDTGYGKLSADVRYYGGTADSGKGDVIVAAYETPDFTGVPAAVLRLEDGSLADLAVTNNAVGFAAVSTNNLVTFDGLHPGNYYMMAFIDRNGNGRRDAFETWGYANYVGRGSEDMYDPAPITVSSAVIVAPAVVVFMEDTDINQNREPDSEEPLALMEEAARTMSTDGGDDEDTWDEWAGGFDLDVVSDASFAVSGDVMAYATINAWFVTLDDNTELLVIPGSDKHRPEKGDMAADYNEALRSTYRYGWGTNFVYGVGSNVTASAGARIKSVFDVEAALVHAQVYDFFGFDPTTANPTVTTPVGVSYEYNPVRGYYAVTNYMYGANTKPFTALDKYLVCRYLENVYGLADETDMTTNGTWSAYTLKPGDPDNNSDGIPDGWELYLMFGTDRTADSLDVAKIAPFAKICGVDAVEYVRDKNNTPDGAKKISIFQKYNGGNSPLDPWVSGSVGGIDDDKVIEYNLSGDGAANDDDGDGLPNYTEYLISEVFKFGDVSPGSATTNGETPDYFRRVMINGNLSKLYLGEMFTDHDFMEDWWENQFGSEVISSSIYDPHGDYDGDGWSNWAECRAGTMPDLTAMLGPDGDEFMEYPVPQIKMRVSCTSAASIDAPIIVQSYADEGAADPDATWIVPGSSSSVVQEWPLGMNKGTAQSFNCGPGKLLPGSFSVAFRDPNEYVETVSVGTNGNVTSRKGVWMVGASEWRHVGVQEVPASLYLGLLNKLAYGETIGYVDYTTGEVKIDFSKLTDFVYISEDGTWNFTMPETNSYTRIDLSKSYVKLAWESKRVSSESWWNFSLTRADSGHVREGKNMFTAFADLDGNGAYTPGEPFGVARNVDVGWSKAEFAVELTAESPICSRPEVADIATNGTSMVYVYRCTVDNVPLMYNTITNRLVLVKDIGNRTSLNEGDFLSDTEFDIDWATFRREVVGSVPRTYPVTAVTYRVYSQYISPERFGVVYTNDTPNKSFTREFGVSRATAVPVAPGEDSTIFYGSQPTFRWRMEGERPDTFTAFAIQIKSGSEVIWNSGTQLAPPRNVDGEYVWKAPLHAGDQTPLGKVFGNTNNYTWAVTMYNSKFQSDVWSTNRAFRVNVYATTELNGTDRYTINAAVKYFGPGTFRVKPTQPNGAIRVEAYTSPDFSGEPVARTFVKAYASVTNASFSVNAVLSGLDAGTYYVRAFLDSDGDFKRSDWESWGYACPRSEADTSAIYAPTPVTIGSGESVPKVTVYIEDADTDQDWLPDAWEYDGAGTDKTDFLLKKGPMENTHNGYISVNPNLEAAISDLIGTAGSGTPRYLASARPGLLSSAVPPSVAALVLGVNSVEPMLDGKTLAIKSLTLEDGAVKLTLGADVDDPTAGTVFVTDGMVRATVVVKYAESLGGEWKSVEKSIEKKVEDGTVSEEISFLLKELGLDATKGFFKVELKQ